MNEYIAVEKVSENGLIRWEWRFWFYEHTLWLDYYIESERASRRHRFVVTESFSRLNLRGSTMKEADVILPATIKEEALKRFCESVVIKRWAERGQAGK